jgi:hypothetical protein
MLSSESTSSSGAPPIGCSVVNVLNFSDDTCGANRMPDPDDSLP